MAETLVIANQDLFLKQNSFFEQSVVIADRLDDTIFIVDEYTATLEAKTEQGVASSFLNLIEAVLPAGGLILGKGAIAKGVFNSSTTYFVNEVVSFIVDNEKNFYICTVSSTTNFPTDENDWALYSTILIRILPEVTNVLTDFAGVYDLALIPIDGEDPLIHEQYFLQGRIFIEKKIATGT